MFWRRFLAVEKVRMVEAVKIEVAPANEWQVEAEKLKQMASRSAGTFHLKRAKLILRAQALMEKAAKTDD